MFECVDVLFSHTAQPFSKFTPHIVYSDFLLYSCTSSDVQQWKKGPFIDRNSRQYIHRRAKGTDYIWQISRQILRQIYLKNLYSVIQAKGLQISNNSITRMTASPAMLSNKSDIVRRALNLTT